MGNKVRRLPLNDLFDIGRSESWFTAMAEKGLHFKQIGKLFLYFEKGAPTQTRYRMEVSPAAPSAELLALYEEGGWDYVGSGGMLHIFRSDNPNATEIHTDPAMQAETLAALDKCLRTPFWVILACVAAMALLLAATWGFSPEPMFLLVGGQLPQQFLLIVLDGYVLFCSLRSHRRVKRLRQTLAEGIPIDHNAPYRRRRCVAGVSFALILALCLFAFVLPLRQMTAREEFPLPAAAVLPTLRLAEIEPESELLPDVYLREDGTDFHNRIEAEWSLFVPVQLTIREDARVPGRKWSGSSAEYSPSLTTYYYEAAFEPLAHGLLGDLMHRYAFRYEGKRAEEHPLAPFDECYLLGSMAFVRLGKQLACVSYYGEAPNSAFLAALPLLAQHMADFAA